MRPRQPRGDGSQVRERIPVRKEAANRRRPWTPKPGADLFDQIQVNVPWRLREDLAVPAPHHITSGRCPVSPTGHQESCLITAASAHSGHRTSGLSPERVAARGPPRSRAVNAAASAVRRQGESCAGESQYGGDLLALAVLHRRDSEMSPLGDAAGAETTAEGGRATGRRWSPPTEVSWRSESPKAKNPS